MECTDATKGPTVTEKQRSYDLNAFSSLSHMAVYNDINNLFLWGFVQALQRFVELSDCSPVCTRDSGNDVRTMEVGLALYSLNFIPCRLVSLLTIKLLK